MRNWRLCQESVTFFVFGVERYIEFREPWFLEENKWWKLPGQE